MRTALFVVALLGLAALALAAEDVSNVVAVAATQLRTNLAVFRWTGPQVCDLIPLVLLPAAAFRATQPSLYETTQDYDRVGAVVGGPAQCMASCTSNHPLQLHIRPALAQPHGSAHMLCFVRHPFHIRSSAAAYLAARHLAC